MANHNTPAPPHTVSEVLSSPTEALDSGTSSTRETNTIIPAENPMPRAIALAFSLRLAGGGLAVELALVLAVPLLLQGLALLHAETARRGWWRRLPWVVYLMLVLATPQLASLLVLLGLVDNWFDFRNRPLR